MRTKLSCCFVLVLLVALGVPWLAAQRTPSLRITSGPMIERADDHSATIAWSTDAPSSSRVWYGTDKNNLTQMAEASYASGDTHRVQITNLRPGTTYYFEVDSGEGRGAPGQAESQGVMSFHTAAMGQAPIRNERPVMADAEPGENSGQVHITNGPTIERLSDTSATIAWSTDRRGSSRVNYGGDPNNLTELAESPWGQGGLTHRVELRNLRPNTIYYFSVETGQAQGTGGAEIESQRAMSFKTPPQGAPAESNVRPR